MDFPRFVSLLDKKALFFVRADRLEDEFEGSYSRPTIALRPIKMKKAGFPENGIGKVSRAIPKVNKKFRKFILLNCWHANEGESTGMWKLYCGDGNGVAIQSTFKRLADSFQDFENDVYIGKIQYVDYETEVIPEGNIFSPFLYKRKNFAHEQELRACVLLAPLDKGDRKMDLDVARCKKGKYVPVNLNILIDKVVAPPNAENWFKNLVRSILHKYGYAIKPIQSNLNKDPLF